MRLDKESLDNKSTTPISFTKSMVFLETAHFLFFLSIIDEKKNGVKNLKISKIHSKNRNFGKYTRYFSKKRN